MSRRLLKFRVVPGDGRIETADAPRFLAAGAQGADIVVWAEATVGCGVLTILTGAMTGEVPPDADYIGTATQADGIVVHVYAKTRA